MRNGGMRNFDNPLYGPNSGAQTQTDANGVAVGTQAGHYDVPKSKKGKGNANYFSESFQSLKSCFTGVSPHSLVTSISEDSNLLLIFYAYLMSSFQ